MPLLKPAYGFVVRPGNTIATLVANPSKFLLMKLFRPFDPPISIARMAVPQKIPNAVMNVRVLFWASVVPISRQFSMSNIGFFIF
jgi:hypothetical protein